MELWETVLIACIPALISGIASWLLANKNAKSEIKRMEISFQQQIKILEQKSNSEITNAMFDKLMDSVLKTPEMKRELSNAVKGASNRRRKK